MTEPETELIRKCLLAFIEREIRLAESEIADIRERHSVFSEDEFSQAVRGEQWHRILPGRIISSGKTNHLISTIYANF